MGVWGEGLVGGCGGFVSGARLERAAPQLVLLPLAAAVLGELQDARARHLQGQVEERVGVAGPGREREGRRRDRARGQDEGSGSC